jgi:hypothetical protein
MACPAQQRERKKFKGSAEELRLVDAIFENSRLVAKVTSAAEYVVNQGDDAWPLYVALECLIAERRDMRSKLERLLRGRMNVQAS